MYADYNRIFLQWQAEKIIREVPPKVKCLHFLPHRAVCKENSWTTPLLPVFDTLCKTERGSINDYLHKGPNLLDLLPSFLLRCREYKVAFTADIQELHHLHLVFGLNCSPYLLSAVLRHHFLQWSGDKESIELLTTSFYVNNLLSSLPNPELYLKF